MNNNKSVLANRLIKLILVKRVGLAIIGLSLATFINSSYAVSMSTYKIHLDHRKKSYDFIIYNKEVLPQTCELKLRPIAIDKTGKVQKLKYGDIALNSADALLRFSPKKFSLDAGRPQKIKFKLRAKRGIPKQEYRSYLSVNCTAIKSNTSNTGETNIKLKPMLVHNIPILARVGPAKYELGFSAVAIQANRLTVSLNKTGIYSTYGWLKLINKKTKEVISDIEKFTMPIEVESKRISLNLKGANAENLQLLYVESEHFVNPKTIEFDIQ